MADRLGIDALRAFAAVVDAGGVTRAATRLALSQSAVSHRMRRLEDEVATPLFAGDGPPGAARLTDAGARLLGYARRILALHGEALATLTARDLSGTVRLGLTEATTAGDLARILARFARLHPDVAVRAHVAQSTELETELDAGATDVALPAVFVSEVRPGDRVLRESALHWVAAPDLVLPEGGAIPFLAFDDACFWRRWAFGRPELSGRLTEVLRCSGSAGIAAAVEAGMGAALLDARRITASMVRLARPDLPAPPRVADVLRLRADAAGPVTRALTEAIVAG